MSRSSRQGSDSAPVSPSSPSSSSSSLNSNSPIQNQGLYPNLNPGILPVIGISPDDGSPLKPPGSSAATGASAAGVRALTSQAVAFYFRAPVKAFFRTRVDYLAYARALQEQQAAISHALLTQLHHTSPRNLPPPSAFSNVLIWLKGRMHGSTPGVIASAVRHYGWRVVPDHVLPPLIANVGVGAVLYTSYLHILGRLHPESALASKRVYPPPAPIETFTAGFLAGSIQSVVAAPLDAVQARYDLNSSAAGMTGSGNPLPRTHHAPAATPTTTTTTTTTAAASIPKEKPLSMWSFSSAKLREIGMRGIFAGWGLSFLKDSLGSAVFFTTFEYLKAQGYYSFVTWYYGALSEDTIVLLSRRRPTTTTTEKDKRGMPTIIRPHYAIEPAFLLLAGMGASFAQQVILHPLSHVQVEHWERLEALDAKAGKIRARYLHMKRDAAVKADGSVRQLHRRPAHYGPQRWGMMRAYWNAYRKTWAACQAGAKEAGLSMRQYLFRGFWWNTIRQVPSTSAGLIIFELVRRKYGMGRDPVRISKDGYDILLN